MPLVVLLCGTGWRADGRKERVRLCVKAEAYLILSFPNTPGVSVARGLAPLPSEARPPRCETALKFLDFHYAVYTFQS